MRVRLTSGLPLLGLFIAAELAAIFIYGRMILSHFQPHFFSLPGDIATFRTNAAVSLGLLPPLNAAEAGVVPYMNPPPFLLITAPLARLSPFWAYMGWNGFGLVALALAGRVAKFPWPAIALGLIAPSVLYCVAIGQVGLIISSLVILALVLLQTNPVLAGVAAACIVIKPQFAILLPVAFLAARSGRGFAAAALSTVLLCALSFCIFGYAAWRDFFTTGVPLAHYMLTRPWPLGYQSIMVSPFIMLRSLGSGLSLAFAVQIAATLTAAAACWYLWRPASPVDMPRRLLLTLCLVPLAASYAYIYDLPGLGMALVSEVIRRQGQFILPLVLFWLATALYIIISMFSFVTGAALLTFLTICLWPRAPVTAPLAHPRTAS